MEGPSLPLHPLTFSLVGPGKVGRSLAAWCESAGARLSQVAGRDAVASLSTAGEDLLLLCLPETALPEVAAALARRPQARVALHTAGSLPAAVLAPLRASDASDASDCAVGSLHPLKAFPRALLDPAAASGVFFAIDGDPAAVALARRLVAAWGGEAAELPAESRLLYHFAATLAAGGVMTLLALADDLALRLGLDPAVGRGYLELARGAVEAAQVGSGAAGALTGPVARGDGATFARQLEALGDLAPETLPLVLRLARETLHQRERREPADEARRSLAAEIERRLRD